MYPVQVDACDETDIDLYLDSTFKKNANATYNTCTTCRGVTRKMRHSNEDSAKTILESVEETEILPGSD